MVYFSMTINNAKIVQKIVCFVKIKSHVICVLKVITFMEWIFFAGNVRKIVRSVFGTM